MDERGDQANDCPWYSESHSDPIGVGERRSTCQPIESSANRHEFSRVPQGVQRSGMNSETKGLTSAKHAAVPLKGIPGIGETGGRADHNVWIKYTDSIHNVRAYYPL
jgi:hypothetical protein